MHRNHPTKSVKSLFSILIIYVIAELACKITYFFQNGQFILQKLSFLPFILRNYAKDSKKIADFFHISLFIYTFAGQNRNKVKIERNKRITWL